MNIIKQLSNSMTCRHSKVCGVPFLKEWKLWSFQKSLSRLFFQRSDPNFGTIWIHFSFVPEKLSGRTILHVQLTSGRSIKKLRAIKNLNLFIFLRIELSKSLLLRGHFQLKFLMSRKLQLSLSQHPSVYITKSKAAYLFPSWGFLLNERKKIVIEKLEWTN